MAVTKAVDWYYDYNGDLTAEYNVPGDGRVMVTIEWTKDDDGNEYCTVYYRDWESLAIDPTKYPDEDAAKAAVESNMENA